MLQNIDTSTNYKHTRTHTRVRARAHTHTHTHTHREDEEQAIDHLIFQCDKLRNQMNEMIKQIKTASANWPTMTETLVNNYLPIFVNFVKSIDFTDMQ